MKEVYKKIWELAMPYYIKGRPMDIDHIEWMMQDAEIVCQQEKIDDFLLLPLVILHDVGYSINRGTDKLQFDPDFKTIHMKDGAKIAKEILNRVDYPKEKIEKISYYISVHDNWCLGDDSVYQNDTILHTFNDLDYMWMAAPKGFIALKKQLGKNDKEMIKFLEENDKPVKRPFTTKTTKKLYEDYLLERKKESGL